MMSVYPGGTGSPVETMERGWTEKAFWSVSL